MDLEEGWDGIVDKDETEQETSPLCSAVERLVMCFDELLAAAIDYVEYSHSGDPWEEDARAMGEMELDELNRTGKIAEYKELLAKLKMDT